MTDLQDLEIGGSTEKTLWQHCQLVIVENPGEMRDKTGVLGWHHTIKDQTGKYRERTVSLLTKCIHYSQNTHYQLLSTLY